MKNLSVHLTTFLVAVVAGYFGGYAGRGYISPSREVRVKRLVIVDSEGRIRAGIGVSESRGTVELSMLDHGGALRAAMTVSADGAAVVSIGSPDAKNSMAMVTTGRSQAHFSITNEHAKPIVSLGMLPNGPLGLTIHDGKNYVPRVQAGADKDGNFGMPVTDASGTPVWSTVASEVKR